MPVFNLDLGLVRVVCNNVELLHVVFIADTHQ